MNKIAISVVAVLLAFSPLTAGAAALTDSQARSLIQVVQSSPETPASAFTGLITAFSSISELQATTLITVVQAAPGVAADAFVGLLMAFTVDPQVSEDKIGAIEQKVDSISQNVTQIQDTVTTIQENTTPKNVIIPPVPTPPEPTPQVVTVTKSVSTDPSEGTLCPIFTFTSDRPFSIEKITFTESPAITDWPKKYLDLSKSKDAQKVTSYRLRSCFFQDNKDAHYITADVVFNETIIKNNVGTSLEVK